MTQTTQDHTPTTARNTRVAYMYRDAANWKVHQDVVIKGTLDPTLLFAALKDGELFIPSQLGLPEQRHNDGWTPDDHVFFELISIVSTTAAPTTRTTAVYVASCARRAIVDGWNVRAAYRRLRLPE